MPQDIINYLRDDLKLSENINIGYDQSRTLYRHKKEIRAYLQVTAFDKQARHLISEAVSKSAEVMDNPADLINVAIEMLVKDRYELPGFNSLNRLVCRLRTRVNHQLFSQVIAQLDEKYLNYNSKRKWKLWSEFLPISCHFLLMNLPKPSGHKLNRFYKPGVESTICYQNAMLSMPIGVTTTLLCCGNFIKVIAVPFFV
jgi:hypothetical protein